MQNPLKTHGYSWNGVDFIEEIAAFFVIVLSFQRASAPLRGPCGEFFTKLSTESVGLWGQKIVVGAQLPLQIRL
jgi:hypothetical protein